MFLETPPFSKRLNDRPPPLISRSGSGTAFVNIRLSKRAGGGGTEGVKS